jgi:hypothetical protein
MTTMWHVKADPPNLYLRQSRKFIAGVINAKIQWTAAGKSLIVV